MGDFWSRGNPKGNANANKMTKQQDFTPTQSTIMDLPSCDVKSLRLDNTKLEPIENSSLFMYNNEEAGKATAAAADTGTVVDMAYKQNKSADSSSLAKDLPSVSLKSLDIKLSRLEPIQSETRFMYQPKPKVMATKKVTPATPNPTTVPAIGKKLMPCLTKVGKLLIPKSVMVSTSSTSKFSKTSELHVAGSKKGKPATPKTPSKIGTKGKLATPTKHGTPGKKPATPLASKLKSPMAKKSMLGKKERPKTPVAKDGLQKTTNSQATSTQSTPTTPPPPPASLPIKRPKDNN